MSISAMPRGCASIFLVMLHAFNPLSRYTPISEHDFFDTIFEPIYEPDRATPDAMTSHRLAILFMVFALGALLDLDRSPNSPESMHYYHLSRAALSQESVLEEPSVAAAQALVSNLSINPRHINQRLWQLLMTHFMFLAEMGSPRWVVMGIVVKLAISVSVVVSWRIIFVQTLCAN